MRTWLQMQGLCIYALITDCLFYQQTSNGLQNVRGPGGRVEDDFKNGRSMGQHLTGHLDLVLQFAMETVE